jgi:PAS domain S-box-containing protein
VTRKKETTKDELEETAELRLRLDEAEETLRAIRQGEVDALVVSGPGGDQIYTLQGAEHPYRVLVESINEGALTLTERGTIIYCNEAFAGMSGTSCSRLVTSSFRDLVFEKDKEKFDTLWKNALLGNGTAELELKLKDGRLPVYLSCSRRAQDEVLTVFAIVSDISERKKAMEELKKAHDELELRVEERTKELSDLNATLKKEIAVRRQAEEEILRRVEELRLSNEQLGNFNLAAVGRELRMVELKREVNELSIQLGQAPRYDLDFAEGEP